MRSLAPARHVQDQLAKRIELVSMDRFCDDITVALYLSGIDRAAVVHSYSSRPGVPARLVWIASAMCVLAGMRAVGDDAQTAEFTCGSWHQLAARRAFLEACKADPTIALAPRPLETDDTRASQRITVTWLGGGRYGVTAVAADPTAPSRAPGVAAGLAKLAELDVDESDPTRVTFACDARHDALVGLLLPRAINVRATLRELEEAANRGLLLAPSAQKDTP